VAVPGLSGTAPLYGWVVRERRDGYTTVKFIYICITFVFNNFILCLYMLTDK